MTIAPERTPAEIDALTDGDNAGQTTLVKPARRTP